LDVPGRIAQLGERPLHARKVTGSSPVAPIFVYAAIRPGHQSSAVRGLPERVYVPNSVSGTVTEIDPATFAVLRTFPTGSSDQHITPGWNLRRLYVNNTSSNTAHVSSPRIGRPIRTIPVADPYNLYLTPNGSKGIVVAEASSGSSSATRTRGV
jgi:YVTN family beta-propeller protein